MFSFISHLWFSFLEINLIIVEVTNSFTFEHICNIVLTIYGKRVYILTDVLKDGTQHFYYRLN